MGNLLQSRGTPLSTDTINETVCEIRDMEWILMYEDADANTDYHAELYMEMARSADRAFCEMGWVGFAQENTGAG